MKRSVGQAISHLLEAYGVDTIFGIPGVHNVEMYRGLLDTKIRHVLARHEQGAGFMADGYARVSGKPGVCYVISGPGVTNIMTPMGQAYSDSIPMLVIASVHDLKDIGQGKGRLHDIKDQRGAAEIVAASAVTAMSAEDIPRLIGQAFAGFAANRPRPAYIEIPIDIQSAPAEGDWSPVTPPALPEPSPEAVDEAVRMMSEAERPVIIVGGGATEAGQSLSILAERLDAIVIPTIAGKGVVPDTHPLSLGSHLPQEPVKRLVAAADVVMAIGTELSETDMWEETLKIDGALIRIDLDPAVMAGRHRAALAIQADAGKTAADMAAALEVRSTAPGQHESAKIVAELATTLADDSKDVKRAQHRKVLEALRDVLPRDGIISTDMTQIAYAGDEIFPVDQPRSWMHPAGYGTLGYGLPAAIGAKIAAPDRPTVALVGDYGFQYTFNEMAVAKELDLTLVVILWNNEALGQIRDDMVSKQIAPVAVEQQNPDFQKLADAFGYHTAKPDSLNAFTAEVWAALDRAGPSLIEIRPDAADRA